MDCPTPNSLTQTWLPMNWKRSCQELAGPAVQDAKSHERWLVEKLFLLRLWRTTIAMAMAMAAGSFAKEQRQEWGGHGSLEVESTEHIYTEEGTV